MNGAQALVRSLLQLGVEHVFGLPGDTGMTLYDALYDEPRITHIMARDERSASFMAQFDRRASGLSTSGRLVAGLPEAVHRNRR